MRGYLDRRLLLFKNTLATRYINDIQRSLEEHRAVHVHRPKGKPADLAKVHPPQQPSSVHYDGRANFEDADEISSAYRRCLYRILADGDHWSDIEICADDIAMLLGALTEVYALIGCEMTFEAIKMRRGTVYQERG
jgi:hypothetical protein